MSDIRPYSGAKTVAVCPMDPDQNRAPDGTKLYSAYECTRRHCPHTGRCANEAAGQTTYGSGGRSNIGGSTFAY